VGVWLVDENFCCFSRESIAEPSRFNIECGLTESSIAAVVIVFVALSYGLLIKSENYFILHMSITARPDHSIQAVSPQAIINSEAGYRYFLPGRWFPSQLQSVNIH